MMGLYTFTLEQFHIDNTRSRHEDTDSGAFALRVGNRTFPAQTFSAGDVNNGDHGVNLTFGPVPVADASLPVAISYQIYNGDTGNLQVSLPSMSEDLGQQAVDYLTQGAEQGDPSDYTDFPDSGVGGDDGNLNWEDGSWIKVLQFINIGSILFPNCDGFVVIGTIGKTKASWDQAINQAGGITYRQTIRYPGSDSAAGCGSNSDYTVTWSVTRRRAIGPLSVRKFLRDNGITLRPGLRSVDPANPRLSVRALLT
jgi:hypothetical protein